jgi:hypothetical protein
MSEFKPKVWMRCPLCRKQSPMPDPDVREWVGLTEERIKEIWLDGKDHGDDWKDVLALARAFEAELRSMNK